MSLEEIQLQKEKELEEAFNEWLKTAPACPPTMYATLFEAFKYGHNSGQSPTGNQYTGYLKEGNKTLEKIGEDEPIFILRGQDNTAPSIILQWIAKNLDTVDEAKLKEAYQVVLAMRRYSFRRDPT